MAINVIQTDGGHELKYTTTGAVTAGHLLMVGNVPGIALESATGSGQVICVQVGCAATVTKKADTGTAITVGGFVTYTATGSPAINKVHGSAATASVAIGYGLAAATTAATTAQVRLFPGPATRIG